MKERTVTRNDTSLTLLANVAISWKQKCFSWLSNEMSVIVQSWSQKHKHTLLNTFTKTCLKF